MIGPPLKNLFVAELPSASCGAILPIVALLLFVLVIFAGLAIDSTILATAKAQQRHNSEYIALASLQAFVQASGDNWNKLDKAVERAREIAGDNLFIAEPFLKIAEPSKELGSDQNTATVYAKPHGQISPGLWYFRPGPGSCNATGTLPSPCPCNTASPTQWSTPCFRRLDFDNPTDFAETPNAMVAELHTSSASPIRTIFAKVAGREFISLSSEATASFVPRHTMFLVDLSRSMHLTTHVPYEKTRGTPAPPGKDDVKLASESSFKIKNLSCPSTNLNPCTFLFGTPPIPTCNFAGGIVDGLYDKIYNFLTPQILLNTRTGVTDAKRHYRNDYLCYTSTFSDTLPDTSTSTETVNYLVDTYNGPTATGEQYYGAQPSSSLLEGIHYATLLLQQRKVPGDLIGLVGFDESARIDIRTFAMSSSLSTTFQDIQDVTDIEGQTLPKLLKRNADHLLFSRTDAQTNLPEALKVAKEMLLAAPGAAQAENSVVLLSDGLTNCLLDRSCGSAFADYAASAAQAVSIIQSDYIPDRIKLHVLLAGDQVSPHTLLAPYQSSTGVKSCMKDTDARFSEPPIDFVDANTYVTGTPNDNFNAMLSGDANFYGPNALYTSVRDTDGLWIPIRPCCKVAGSCTDVRADLELACSTSPASAGTPLTVSPFTDTAGRLTCDPKGSSQKDQIHAGIEEVFSRSPYLLVN